MRIGDTIEQNYLIQFSSNLSVGPNSKDTLWEFSEFSLFFRFYIYTIYKTIVKLRTLSFVPEYSPPQS